MEKYLVKHAFKLMLIGLAIMLFIGAQQLMPPMPEKYMELVSTINRTLTVIGIMCFLGYFTGISLDKKKMKDI